MLEFQLRLLGERLRAGAVLAYPTEAVYGLGCDPRNPEAVNRLLALKLRPDRKGVILIASDFQQLSPYLGALPAGMAARMRATWPGPVTWVVPASRATPGWISGGRDTIAVRVTAHPLAAGLCRAFGGALVSTSANRSGCPPARSGLRARLLFGDQIEVINGPVGGLARPTAILDARTGAVIRPG